MRRRTFRAIRQALAAIMGWLVRLAAVAAGVPVLAIAIGRPWRPPHLAVADLTAPIGRVDSGMLVYAVGCLAWLGWLVITVAVLAEPFCLAGRALRRRRRRPRRSANARRWLWYSIRRLRLRPTETAAAALLGSTAVAAVSGVITAVDATAAAASLGDQHSADQTDPDLNPAPRGSGTAPVETTPSWDHTARRAAAVDRGPATVLVGETRYSYEVKRGDHLWKIAQAWLGDADRWPEICTLNKHRHFPAVGGTLRDCNLIYPGWDLRLPADARPPAQARLTPPPTGHPDGTTPPTEPIQPTPGPTTTTPSESSPTTSENPTGTNATIPSSTSPSLSASASPQVPFTADGDGVRLPDGSWVSWSLAGAVTAAAALVWLHRRRRFLAVPDEPAGDPPTAVTGLPQPVTALHRAVVRNPQLPLPEVDAERAAAVPEMATLPSGGVGLIGGGAVAAARAALIATLASGGPRNPHGRGEVVIDATTLTTLLGADPAAVEPLPRLHVADNVDHALTIVETQLLHRSRILDEHALSDLDTLRQQAPDEEALPPILLVCTNPPRGVRSRLQVSLALGAAVQISAILLGEWEHGVTVDVDTDGHTRPISGHAAQPVPPRLPVLQEDTAVQILGTLREAHTGQLSMLGSSPTNVTAARVTLATRRPSIVRDVSFSPAAFTVNRQGRGHESQLASEKVQLRVLGPPRIDDITEPGRPLRAKALELAVFLACHPDGAATREIGEYLEPDARLSQADQRVHTNASNLRHNLARAARIGIKAGYVIKTAGRYRLDPDTVDVDLWRIRELLRAGRIATGDRRRTLLADACDLYTAPLADGRDYEWIAAHRETARRLGIEAHQLLADDLLGTAPRAASDLLDKAINLDPYNEALYRAAMHARHALGDADGIRTLLRALARALADLDAEPDEDTIATATRLRAALTAPTGTTSPSTTVQKGPADAVR